MEQGQRERLEQELRFLKESYEADVISKEEYEKGKDRIEMKLNENGDIDNVGNDGQAENIGEIAPKDEKPEETGDPQPEAGPEEAKNEESEGNVTGASATSAQNEEKFSGQDGDRMPEPAKKEKESRVFMYTVVFIVLALVAFFSYSLLSPSDETPDGEDAVTLALCNSDADCLMEGSIGRCASPGTKDAKCEFIGPNRLRVLVLNDKGGCFNCNTQRVLSILNEWFGDLEKIEYDYSTAEGKALAESLDIKALPAYVFDENITQKQSFEQFKRAFIKRGSSYVLSEDAAASSLYFKRQEISNKLDLFVKEASNTTTMAENNLKEFLEAFPDVDFDVYYSDDEATKELGIRTFPTFLVNNRVKFTGIQTAEKIKENFCSMNKAEECSKILSKSLI